MESGHSSITLKMRELDTYTVHIFAASPFKHIHVECPLFKAGRHILESCFTFRLCWCDYFFNQHLNEELNCQLWCSKRWAIICSSHLIKWLDDFYSLWTHLRNCRNGCLCCVYLAGLRFNTQSDVWIRTVNDSSSKARWRLVWSV